MGSEVQYLLLVSDKGEFLRQVLIGIGLIVPTPMIFYTDSDSSIITMRRSKLSSKMIHEIIRNNYLKQLIDKGLIKLVHVRSEELRADLLTKYLATKQFNYLLNGLMMEIEVATLLLEIIV